MSSQMPTRKSVQPVLKMIEDLKPSQKGKEIHQNGKGKAKKDKQSREGNELVQLKDEQIKKMVEKISSLHTYNGQFSVENEHLKHENVLLKQSLIHLKQKLESTRNQSCTECELLHNEKTALESEVQIRAVESQELKSDIDMMKVLVFRLNVQLERYQGLKGRNKEPTNFDDGKFPEMPQNCNWGAIKSNILSPLLNAYEEIIDEKNEMIQQIGNELNTFNFRLNEVLQENDKLNGDMCKLSQERDKLEMARAKMEVQFEVCRKRADLQTKRADILQEKLVEVAGSYEAKVQTQALDNERLRDAYCRTKEELSSYKNHPKGQSAELLVVESLKECKSLFEELKKQHEEEKSRFLEETKNMKSQSLARESELTTCKTEIVNLNTILEKQKECNEALNNKLILLKDALQRIRKSREALKSKLKIAKTVRNCDDDLKARTNDVQKMDHLLRQTIHVLQLEVEKLNRKMQYKENIIKKLLQDQLKVAGHKQHHAKGRFTSGKPPSN